MSAAGALPSPPTRFDLAGSLGATESEHEKNVKVAPSVTTATNDGRPMLSSLAEGF
jgi:hypothetical protein